MAINLAIGAAAVLFVCWVAGLGTPGMFNFPRPFSKEVWRETSDPSNKARCSMTFDLRHRVGIIGKTPAEIEQLLGAPDDGRWDDGRWEETWYLLCDQTFFVDAWMLGIRWDDGRAMSTRIAKS